MIYNDEQFGKLYRATEGACFHGEVWERCPYCKWGHEMMGKRPKYTRESGRVKIYECEHCGKLFYDI